MKTAISVKDELMEEADEAAREIGCSRSALFARAMAEFLQSRRRANLTAKLNEVYGEEGSQDDELGMVRKFKSKAKVDDKW